ncbi:ATP-binding protein [Geoglobus sp.]
MQIKVKISLAVTLAFTLFYILLSIIVTTFMASTTEEILQNRIENRLGVFEEVLKDKFSQLTETVILSSENAESDTEMLEIAKIHDVEYIMICDENGNVVKVLRSTPFDDPDFVADCEETAKMAETNRGLKKGFVVGNSVYLIASYPIYRHGKFVGYIVAADVLNEMHFEKLKELVGVDILEFARDKVEREGEIGAFYAIRDMQGREVGYFKLAYVNTIHPLVTRSFYTGLVMSAFITFMAIIATSAAIDRNVIRRIEILSNFMKNIRSRGYYTGERIFVTGDDEIKMLADSINESLEEIEKREKELKKISENLRIVNRILRHDILNDLAVIRGYAEMGQDEGCRLCDRIVERVDQAAETIKRMRSIESVLKESELSGYRISDVVSEVMGKFEIEWEISGDAEVLADDGIYSVFENLVSNAIRHGKSDRVMFEVEESGDDVIVRVIDFGTGIPDDVRERIFEEGFSTARSFGLGLYIVRKLVEKYGGEISVGDNKPSGAVFTIKLKKAKGESMEK